MSVHSCMIQAFLSSYWRRRDGRNG